MATGRRTIPPDALITNVKHENRVHRAQAIFLAARCAIDFIPLKAVPTDKLTLSVFDSAIGKIIFQLPIPNTAIAQIRHQLVPSMNSQVMFPVTEATAQFEVNSKSTGFVAFGMA